MDLEAALGSYWESGPGQGLGVAADRWAELGAGTPKTWGPLASMRPCVRARKHLCTSYIVSLSNGHITRMSYKILKVQNNI